MSYTIAWEPQGAGITYKAVVGFPEFMQAVLTVHEHPDYATFKYVIHDMSAVSKLDFAEVNMTQLRAQELGARYTNPRVKASVVTDSPAMAAMVLNFSTLTKLEVRVFQDLVGANAWSGRPSFGATAPVR